jgi:hypothetical protein
MLADDKTLSRPVTKVQFRHNGIRPDNGACHDMPEMLKWYSQVFDTGKEYYDVAQDAR